ncbi:MAG: hypothetical protein ACI81V_000774, partial [Lentimonas sp.]
GVDATERSDDKSDNLSRADCPNAKAYPPQLLKNERLAINSPTA